MSNFGGSPLVEGLQRGLQQAGHRPEPYQKGERYDLVLIFNQCAHVTDYVYPPFPDDNAGRLVFVDSAEYGYFRRCRRKANAAYRRAIQNISRRRSNHHVVVQFAWISRLDNCRHRYSKGSGPTDY